MERSSVIHEPGPQTTSSPAVAGFSAVLTTGIYCRPDCTARPHPRNVVRYDSAAAAEAAGFRACLRCRPYRRDVPITSVGPELICRAVRMIVDGALDDTTEDELASSIGVSARHLRRQFIEHVGVTPGQLARSRRAHFARRLLDDSELTIGEITFASGFGSIRQLNRTITEVFHASPTELRARRRAADRLVADGGLAVRLGYAPPYDWDGMLAYLRGRTIAGVESVQDGVYRRTIVVDGSPGVIEVSDGVVDHLLLRVHLPFWDGLIHHVARVRRMFGLDVDPNELVAAHGDDVVLGRLVRSHPGVRMPGTWDAFEIGVRAIIGQQVSVAGANTITARLVARHGVPVPGLAEMGLTHAFPSAEVLADDMTDLDGLGLTTSRVAAIRSFAVAVRDGVVRFDRSVPLDRFIEQIVALPGLGPWTANYIALRLGEPDAFPHTDLGLRKGAEILTGQTLTYSELLRLAEQWRPLRSHAAIHLWRTLGL
jgi:AraC family transcriptional regulator, regulatory protein of adaptative response / DNA-3-methyladenine glycosylase II